MNSPVEITGRTATCICGGLPITVQTTFSSMMPIAATIQGPTTARLCRNQSQSPHQRQHLLLLQYFKRSVLLLLASREAIRAHLAITLSRLMHSVSVPQANSGSHGIPQRTRIGGVGVQKAASIICRTTKCTTTITNYLVVLLIVKTNASVARVVSAPI